MTVVEAAIKALSHLGKESTLEEILDVIEKNHWFNFKSPDKMGVLRAQLRKASEVHNGEFLPEFKILRLPEHKKYVLMEKPFPKENTFKKIFISHSSKDRDYVTLFVDLLRDMGIEKEKIFCTSVQGYGSDIGENFLERIRKELDSTVIVIFILTHNFYNSPMCLSEVGATWIKTNLFYPVVIPPFSFGEIKDPIGKEQGIDLTNYAQLNDLKGRLEKILDLKEVYYNDWERKRNSFIEQIKRLGNH